MTVDQNAYFGQTDPTSAIGDWNKQRFIIQQEIAKLNTSMPVRVVSVSGGGLGPVGFVTIRILVDQLSGEGMAVSHGDIPNVPYVRLQGGANAVIIDPHPGDIGMACFCSRDISAVKNARKSAPPGSWRRYSFSDCMYSGGILNGTPAQYIQFTDGGILIHSPTMVKGEAPLAQLAAPSVQLGNVEAVLRKLVDERMIALHNSHTHSNGPPPDVQITPEMVLTVATEAN